MDKLNAGPVSGKSIRYIHCKISGYTSLILGFIFLFTAIGFILSLVLPEIHFGGFSFLKSNWLIIIFKLNAGIGGMQADALRGVNFLDLTILILFCILCSCPVITVRKAIRILVLIAFVISILAIVLFVVTKIAGRSTVMLSVMLLSIAMLIENSRNKTLIYSGICAGLFLLTGDFTVGIHSGIIAVLFCLGYVLLTGWFFLRARMLLSR